MDTELKLECLKLVYRRDREPTANIVEAKILLDYLLEGTKTEAPKKLPEREPKKKGGNPDFLS